MNLINSDELLLRLAIMRDNPKYTKDQQEAINDCINAVIDTPVEIKYRTLDEGVVKATKSFKKGLL